VVAGEEAVPVVAPTVVSHSTPIDWALAYLVRLLRGEAHYSEPRAVQATAIAEAHKHGRIDSVVVFPAQPLTRGEA
jgi:hypothetical protein